MSSFQTLFLINYLKRMKPEARLSGLQDLLTAFPDDWLEDALSIAQRITKSRKAPGAPPRRVDPRLRRQVP